jgi:hypothetical protein
VGNAAQPRRGGPVHIRDPGGDAAAVQLSFDSVSDKSAGWIDFHNLLRVNGVWKITNKTATHSSR